MTSIRERLNRKAAALIIVFALLITGSGLASLAALSDTLNATTNMSLISIDLKAGGQDTLTTTLDPWSDLPKFRTIPVQFTNTGTGSLTFSISASSGTAGDLTNAVVLGFAKNATDCAAANNTTNGPLTGTSIIGNQSLNDFTMTPQTIVAGGSLDTCISYYLPAGTYSQTASTHTFTFSAAHP